MTISFELLNDVAKQQELKMNEMSAYPQKVTLVVRAETGPGSSIHVTGSSSQFGSWDPHKSPELMTGPDMYPNWTVTLDTSDWPARGLEYKFVILEPEGNVVWEECPNRLMCPKVAHAMLERASGPWFGQAEDPSSFAVESATLSAKPNDVAPTVPKQAWAPTTARTPKAPKQTEAKGEAQNLGSDKWAPTAPSTPMEGDQTKSFAPGNADDMGTIIWDLNNPAAALLAGTVEVVFDADVSKPFALQPDGHGERWSLDFVSTGMAAGLHTFHFLIDGVRSLSKAHLVLGGSNAMLFNGAVRCYLAKHSAREDSIAVPQRAGAHEAFPRDVYEGLFDTSFRLRLCGLALPRPLAQAGGAPAMRFYAAGWRLKKRSGSECEDAFFVTKNAFGVADGLGSMVQFASYGVNSAAYAANLMDKAREYFEKHASSLDGSTTVDHWALGACRYAEERTSEFGASTISVVAIHKNTLGVANLGDSGYMLLRKGAEGMQIVHKLMEQQGGWNCPHQLMRIPPKLAARLPKYTHDHADDCHLYIQEVHEGDLVLLFTDGVRDNLHDEEVLSIVDRVLSPAFASFVGIPEKTTKPTQIARALAKASEIRSFDPKVKVPFTSYSLSLGGKEDDITVIAAWVVPEHYVVANEK